MIINSNLSKFAILLLISSLPGCVSVPVATVNERIKAWESSSYQQLLKYWGLPSKTTVVDQIHYAEWVNLEHDEGNSSVSVGSGTRIGRGSIGIGLTLFQLGGSEDKCSRVVRYQENGKIIDISWKGTQDFCFKLTPDKAKIDSNRAGINGES
jgi:hypothetical protein